uniref:RNase H type-1 domain-containing protein n=1 Tax=Hyaloperonospora arabidopsidis (strain Emoy2) TaxID=559515 RepID=M4BHD5_HYAAE
MVYGRASTNNNYAEYQGLLHGLRQEKANNKTLLHVVGNTALIRYQLRSHHSPRKAHLALLFRKARDLADDIAVVSWGHHYRTFNKMADRLANFAMDSCTLVQVHLPSDRRVVKEVATFLDSDVTHWLENSHNELYDPRSPTATAKDKAISRLQLAQRTAAVRGQTLT